MAQSATKDSGKSPLGIQPFWEKATLEPPIRWEFWRIQLKLAILARERIEVDLLLVDPPEHVLLPPEPAYKDAVDNPTAQSERDRRTRNEQAKTAWKNQCQRVMTIGVLCGDKLWKLCDRKASSLMYLSLGMEGRRVFNSKNSTINLETISTKDLWDVLNTTFIRIHNITFDRYLFLTRKQQKGEPIEKFYGHLKELSENCDLGDKGDTIIRDVFIANMQNEDIQKELLKETVDPEKALAIAINIEMGKLNQLKMNASKTEPQSTVNQVQRTRIANATPFSNMNTTARKKPTTCHFCGSNWTSEHCNKCPARGKRCNNCGIENYFAKVCRKPKDPNSYPKPRPRVNNVEKDDQNEDVNQISANFDPDLESNYSSDEDNCVAVISSTDSATSVDATNLPVTLGNTPTKVLVDSGSVCTIINESLANSIISHDPKSKWIREANPKQLKTFSNEPIHTVGILQTSIQSSNWYANPIEIQVGADGHRSLLGRDLFPALGISIHQSSNRVTINQVDQEYCPIKKQIAIDYPDLISRIGKSKVHTVRSKFHKHYTPSHQKGRRVPKNLLDKVSAELKKLSEQGHIEKLQECSDKNFTSPIVITVKKDKSVKLALDSKILNKAIHKNKYQMPNIDSLIDSISQHTNNSILGDNVYFSTIDLKYAYSQLKLHPDTARHCNFNIICGEATGTYRFKTGFYGLTDMPAEFQKAMDYTLVGLTNTYCFLDDIIVVSKGTQESHLKYVYKCLQKLEADNLRINLSKCHFAKHQINWLGFTFSQRGVKPFESKTAAIAEIKAPKTLKQLRSFLGSVHHLSKFIPNLAEICHPLRPLLKKNEKFIWNENHQSHFEHIKTVIANATENTYFNPTLETRIKCDASRQGLGAALEQLDCEGWKTIAFASRFLNSNEERYSVNELELLGMVWAIEYFKYYLFGKTFTLLTDHKARLSVLKSHRSNKSYNSRLTRWIDRLLPFDFNIEHIPGTRMGLVDYISRQPNQNAKSVNQYDEEFMVATISRIRDAITSLFSNANKIPFQKRHITSNYKQQVHPTRVHSCKPAKISAHNSNASINSLIPRAQVNNYNSEFISNFNCRANQLLQSDTTPAAI